MTRTRLPRVGVAALAIGLTASLAACSSSDPTAADPDAASGDKIVVGLRGSAEAPMRTSHHTLGNVGAGNAEHRANGTHREPSLGHDSERNRCFFGPAATSRASLRISVSSVFLPRRRCNSRI